MYHSVPARRAACGAVLRASILHSHLAERVAGVMNIVQGVVTCSNYNNILVINVINC